MPSTKANQRRGRINEECQREIALMLREIKDPRLSEGLISITACEVSADLKYAKVYYSIYNGEPSDIRKGFISASGFIRRELASRLNLRLTPELTFVYDQSIERGERVGRMLKQIREEQDGREANSQSESQSGEE